MRATYQLSKKTVEVKSIALDLNPWLTSIGSTLDTYDVDALTGLVVEDEELDNVVTLTFSAGAKGHVYRVGVNAAAANGLLSRIEVEVTVLGTLSGDQTGGPGPGGDGVWGSIAGSIADQSDLQSVLASKASASSVNGKANAAEVNAALALKADASAMTTALGLKASASDMTTALADKASIASVAAKADASALAGKSDTSHNHNIGALEDSQLWVRAQIAQYLIDIGYGTGPGSPPPAPPPPVPGPPPPAPGAGTGETETDVPARVAGKLFAVGNPATGVYTLDLANLLECWAGGDAAVDQFTITPRINGTNKPAAVQFMVDDDSGDIADKLEFHAIDSEVGSWLSLQIAATNEAGTTIDWTTGVFVTGSSAGGESEEPVDGTGSLALNAVAGGANYTVSTSAISFAVIPTFAGIVQKSGAPAIAITEVGAGIGDDASVGTVNTTTWASGTPTASGSSNTAPASEWNTLGAGANFEVDADTTEKVFFLLCSIFSTTLTLACTLSDGSSAPIALSVHAGSTLGATAPEDGVSVNRLISIRFKAGSAGQKLNVAATVTAIAGTGGNAHFGSCYVLAA